MIFSNGLVKVLIINLWYFFEMYLLIGMLEKKK